MQHQISQINGAAVSGRQFLTVDITDDKCRTLECMEDIADMDQLTDQVAMHLEEMIHSGGLDREEANRMIYQMQCIQIRFEDERRAADIRQLRAAGEALKPFRAGGQA